MTPLNVSYHGQRVGRLAEVDVKGRRCVFFEYDAAFLRRGIELSPFHLPLRPGLLSREGAKPTDQLPGLFEDSLPDAWGHALMLDWFRKKGIPAHQVTPLLQLGYIGDRGMGALAYEPENSPAEAGEIDLGRLYADALEADTHATFSESLTELGSAVGGAQPKALLGIETGPPQPRFWSGTRTLPPGFEAWLVKFTPAKLRPDNPGADGRIEFAYSLMARAAGIDLPPTRLLKATRAHFAVKRFDREGSTRIHHHTLARMLQVGGGDLDYELFLRATHALTHDTREVLRAYRRAAFNVLGRNDDDHGRNHGFLLRDRQWTLSPAYDVTFRRLAERGMAVCGERRTASVKDLISLGHRAGLEKSATTAILDQIRAALARWRHFADEAEVPAIMAAEIGAQLHE